MNRGFTPALVGVSPTALKAASKQTALVSVHGEKPAHH
jgi:hypothetical protein